jgi:hypothetical protein
MTVYSLNRRTKRFITYYDIIKAQVEHVKDAKCRFQLS